MNGPKPTGDRYIYSCKCCESSPARTSPYHRTHVRRHHPEISAIELETDIVLIRYPGIDLEYWLNRYRNKLETLFTLNMKNIRIKKLLQVMNILRHHSDDLILAKRVLIHNPQSLAEVNKIYENQLIDKFRKASPEVRFRGYLNRDLSLLKKQGHEHLAPAVIALKTIKFIKRQLAANLPKADESESPEAPSEALDEPVAKD